MLPQLGASAHCLCIMLCVSTIKYYLATGWSSPASCLLGSVEWHREWGAQGEQQEPNQHNTTHIAGSCFLWSCKGGEGAPLGAPEKDDGAQRLPRTRCDGRWSAAAVSYHKELLLLHGAVPSWSREARRLAPALLHVSHAACNVCIT